MTRPEGGEEKLRRGQTVFQQTCELNTIGRFCGRELRPTIKLPCGLWLGWRPWGPQWDVATASIMSKETGTP